MKTVFRHASRLTTLAGCAALAACASGPDIRSDVNPAVRFSDYATFAFFSPLATDTAGYESVLTSRLKEATRRNLEAKGYVYSESAPDLLVNFYANIEDKQEIRSYSTGPTMGVGYGYYGYRRGYYAGWSTGTEIQTVNYKQGTLTIDLVDAKEKVLAWQGQAEGRVSKEARQNPGPAIDAVVAEIMSSVPQRTGELKPQ
jgi:hypothetical protein